MSLDTLDTWEATSSFGPVIALTSAMAPVLIGINRLLGLRFMPGSLGNETQVGRLIVGYYEALNRGNIMEAEIFVLRLLAIVSQLEIVQGHDRELFAALRRRLRSKEPTGGTHRGAVFELFAAAELISKGATVRKQDPPDFVVRCRDGGEFHVECRSIKLQQRTSLERVERRLKTAVKAKGKKPYAGPNCALFVDTTNLQHGLLKLGETDPASIIRSIMQESIPASGYGALVAGCTILRKRSPTAEWHLGENDLNSRSLVVKAENIDPDLNQFLDACFAQKWRFLPACCLISEP